METCLFRLTHMCGTQPSRWSPGLRALHSTLPHCTMWPIKHSEIDMSLPILDYKRHHGFLSSLSLSDYLLLGKNHLPCLKDAHGKELRTSAQKLLESRPAMSQVSELGGRSSSFHTIAPRCWQLDGNRVSNAEQNHGAQLLPHSWPLKLYKITNALVWGSFVMQWKITNTTYLLTDFFTILFDS